MEDELEVVEAPVARARSPEPRCWGLSKIFPRPKSVIFRIPSLVSRQLAGLTSRWMSPSFL